MKRDDRSGFRQHRQSKADDTMISDFMEDHTCKHRADFLFICDWSNADLRHLKVVDANQCPLEPGFLAGGSIAAFSLRHAAIEAGRWTFGSPATL